MTQAEHVGCIRPMVHLYTADKTWLAKASQGCFEDMLKLRGFLDVQTH